MLLRYHQETVPMRNKIMICINDGGAFVSINEDEIEVEEDEPGKEARLVVADEAELKRRALRVVPKAELHAVAQNLRAAVAERELRSAANFVRLADAKVDLGALDRLHFGRKPEYAALHVLGRDLLVVPGAPEKVRLRRRDAEEEQCRRNHEFLHF